MIPIAEIFESMQGEGSQGGTPALFIRTAGCNLWNGREEDREKGRGNCSMWCDTVFLKKFSMSIDDIRKRIREYTKNKPSPLVVFTGGEPALWCRKLSSLWLDLLDEGVYVSIETNGTIQHTILDLLCEHELGHIVCSPKRKKSDNSFSHIKLKRCNDLKLVYPYNITFDRHIAYDVLYLQPVDRNGDMGKPIIQEVVEYASKIGARVSVQQHKLMGLE